MIPRFLAPFVETGNWKFFFWFAFPLVPFALYSLVYHASQGVSARDMRVLPHLLFLSITLTMYGIALAHYLPLIFSLLKL